MKTAVLCAATSGAVYGSWPVIAAGYCCRESAGFDGQRHLAGTEAAQ